MARFYVAGCFTDNIIVGKDRNVIEKKRGGPAQFITDVLTELGDEYDVAKGKRGICEIHVKNGEELGRVVSSNKVSLSKVSADVVLASSISGEIPLDKMKGDFGEVYVDAQGFVRDPDNFGGRRKWELAEVGKVKVLKTKSREMEYIPENLVSHIRKNGVLILKKEDGGYTLIENGQESEYRISNGPLPYTLGLRDTLFAAFSSEYAKNRDAKKAMEFAVHYARKYIVRPEKDG
jgi:hypothetical protein